MTNGSEPIPAAPVQEKAPVALEIGAVLLLTLATFLSFLTGAADAGDLAELIGAGMAPTIVALIVLALFRLAFCDEFRTFCQAPPPELLPLLRTFAA